MSADAPPVKVSTAPLWICYLVSLLVIPLAPLFLGSASPAARQAVLAALEFAVVYAAVGLAVMQHDRARGTVQDPFAYFGKGLLAVLAPALGLGAVGAAVGQWVGVLGDADAPRLAWSVTGASVAGILFMTFFWRFAVAMHRPDLIQQTSTVMTWLVLLALIGCGSGAVWALLVLFISLPLLDAEPPRRPGEWGLAAFYFLLPVVALRCVLALAFSAAVAALLLTDCSELVEAVRRAAGGDMTLTLAVVVVLLLAGLASWEPMSAAPFAVPSAVLQTSAFAALLMLALALLDADAFAALEQAVRRAAADSRLAFHCVVVAGAFFAMADARRLMRQKVGEPAPADASASPAPPA